MKAKLIVNRIATVTSKICKENTNPESIVTLTASSYYPGIIECKAGMLITSNTDFMLSTCNNRIKLEIFVVNGGCDGEDGYVNTENGITTYHGGHGGNGGAIGYHEFILEPNIKLSCAAIIGHNVHYSECGDKNSISSLKISGVYMNYIYCLTKSTPTTGGDGETITINKSNDDEYEICSETPCFGVYGDSLDISTYCEYSDNIDIKEKCKNIGSSGSGGAFSNSFEPGLGAGKGGSAYIPATDAFGYGCGGGGGAPFANTKGGHGMPGCIFIRWAKV